MGGHDENIKPDGDIAPEVKPGPEAIACTMYGRCLNFGNPSTADRFAEAAGPQAPEKRLFRLLLHALARAGAEHQRTGLSPV